RGGASSRTRTAGVVRMAPPTPNAPPMTPETNPARIPRAASTKADLGAEALGRATKHVPFARVARPPERLPQGEPADLLHLVVVLRHVAADRVHEEERHALADANAVPDVPVRDVPERGTDERFEPRLFAHLADRGLLGLFPWL